MRILYYLGWLLATAIVCFYMYSSSNQENTIVTDNTTSNDNIEIVDEVTTITTNSEDVANSEGDSDPDVLDESPEKNKDNESSEIIDKKADKDHIYDFLERANIEFIENKVTLDKESDTPGLKSYLDSIAKVLNEEDVYIELVGHTDNSAEASVNYEVGLKRAEYIKKILMTRNVDESKIRVSSKGETEPRVENKDDQSMARNRRVELILKSN